MNSIANGSPETDTLKNLHNLRVKNIDRVIIGTLNINSIANKFDQLQLIIKETIDILIVTETKIDDTFPISQFYMKGYSEPYRLDRNRNCGGIMIFIRQYIPSKLLKKHTFLENIEGLFVEINLRKSKWLIFGTYHPPNQNDNLYFDSVTKALDLYNDYYDKFLLAGDFNAEEDEPCLNSFLFQYDAKNLVKDKTCFKSITNPSCVDLLLTNSPQVFKILQFFQLAYRIFIRWRLLF